MLLVVVFVLNVDSLLLVGGKLSNVVLVKTL
jgi:hypothetical protein